MGNSHSGRLAVVLEKHVYLPGEIVQGAVHLHLEHHVHAEGLHLKCKGEEKTWFKETRQVTRTRPSGPGEEETYFETVEEEHDAEHTFFKTKVHLFTPGHMEAGQYTFPFTFRLPPGLSPSFKYHEHHLSAKIKYKVKAELKVHHGSDVKHTSEFHVNSAPFAAITPAVEEHTHHIRKCCCFDKGPVWMRLATDRTAYTPGETAEMVVEVDNKSSEDLQRLKAKLVRHLHVRAHHGHEKRERHTVSHSDFEGVPANTALIAESARRVPLHLSHAGHHFPPGVDGHLIRCEYVLEVEGDVSCAPDVKVKVPVLMYNGLPPEMSMPVPPPGWAPRVMEAVDVNAVPSLAY